ncbi:MAG TPA: alpha/beta hydrolase [Candidatus Hydrogenedentes bacterium]|nr:alpha/beta hydrolase [Candidatus Hydrogenedentota bacterium]HQH52526.1 alpha/beta hydrolase [Candidatus Hydrogenedentota bacterium]HQM48405.1 alpha/beta hydrolase [Candidatus Hydrogenedentota bacterium]
MNNRRSVLRRIIFWSGLVAVFVFVGVVWAGIHVYRTLETEGQYFDSNGVRLHYIEQGAGSPVILLHGFGTNAAGNWMVTRVLPKLAGEHRVIALDLRGHGRSGKPHDPSQYGIEMVHDVARLMDHLGIERAHVAGYSLGGFVALKFASVYPERTLSVAPCASGWAEGAEKELGFLKELGAALDKDSSLTPLLQRLQPPNEEYSEARLLTVNLAISSINDLTALGALLQSADGLMLTRDELEGITAPVMSIVGSRDPFKEYAEQMETALPRTRLVVIEGGDHFTTITRPQFEQALATFLADPLKGGRAAPESML